jgi:hypothetical protein
MLKLLRNKKVQKRIYIGLAVMIIPAFVSWGVIVGNKETDVQTALALIGRKKISIQQYLKSYNAVQHELALRYGVAGKDMKQALNLKGEAWDRLLLLHYANENKIKTSDSEVVGWLTSQPVFFHRGRFDTQFYKLYIQSYLRMNSRDFEEEIRGLLTIDKIRGKIASGIILKEDEIKKLAVKKHQEAPIVKTMVLEKKSSKKFRALLNELRNKLKINLETYRKIFDEEKE